MPSKKKQTAGSKGLTIEEVIKEAESFLSILNVPENKTGTLVESTLRPYNSNSNKTRVDIHLVENNEVLRLTV